MFHLGIDLGGTKVEGVVLDEHAAVRHRLRMQTEQERGYEHILKRIKTLYEKLKDEISCAEHTLGIGTPGAISQVTGRLKNSNTLCLNDRLTRGELEKILGRSIFLENDANCFALAEALHGAGVGARLVFGVILGTGCGGGLVLDGKLLNGLQGISGEWGHMSIDPLGPVCYCGSRGCVETFISGGGLEKKFFELSKEPLNLREIMERFRAGDALASDFISDFFRNFGRAIANLINILDPDMIVLGGGLSNIDEFYSRGVEEVRRCIFNDNLRTPILKNQLGDSSGVIGAALLGCTKGVSDGS